MRFTPSKGQSPIYTANFAVTGMTGSPDYRQGKQGAVNEALAPPKDYAVASSNSTTTRSSFSTLVRPTSTSSSVYSYVPTFTTPIYQSTASSYSYPGVNANTNGVASTRFQRPSDGSILGGRGFMYLLWPFLMGVAMAL